MNKEKEAVDNSNTAWCLQSQASLKGYRYQVFLCMHWQFPVIIIPNAPARTLCKRTGARPYDQIKKKKNMMKTNMKLHGRNKYNLRSVKLVVSDKYDCFVLIILV